MDLYNIFVSLLLIFVITCWQFVFSLFKMLSLIPDFIFISIFIFKFVQEKFEYFDKMLVYIFILFLLFFIYILYGKIIFLIHKLSKEISYYINFIIMIVGNTYIYKLFINGLVRIILFLNKIFEFNFNLLLDEKMDSLKLFNNIFYDNILNFIFIVLISYYFNKFRCDYLDSVTYD